MKLLSSMTLLIVFTLLTIPSQSPLPNTESGQWTIEPGEHVSLSFNIAVDYIITFNFTMTNGGENVKLYFMDDGNYSRWLEDQYIQPDASYTLEDDIPLVSQWEPPYDDTWVMLLSNGDDTIPSYIWYDYAFEEPTTTNTQPSNFDLIYLAIGLGLLVAVIAVVYHMRSK